VNDPAGAFVDGSTVKRAKAAGLNAANFLQNNDATAFFTRIDDLLVTGPTGTNVNDFRCIVVDNGNYDGQ
jgi:hydroxypyruvate reductase